MLLPEPQSSPLPIWCHPSLAGFFFTVQEEGKVHELHSTVGVAANMSVLSAGNPSAAKASWLRGSSQSGNFRQPRLWRTRVCCAPSAVMSWQAQSGRQALHSLSQLGRWQGHNEGISNLEADIWQAHTNVVHVQRHCCQQQGALREAVSAASPARSQVCFCSAVMELNRANIGLCLSSFAGRPASQCAGRPP